VTRRRAAWLAAGAAALVYLPSLGNRFALDDGAIVERNPAAHSVGAAVRAFGRTYWPPQNAAGQWRPLVILSFAADWQLSRGSPAWLHGVNVAWHAAATGLLVPVLAAYVPVTAALAGAILFAVHPVHVEAVANLVGRAEPMAAVFLMLAVLAGRAIRRRARDGRAIWPAELALLGAVVAGLLTKEHAAVVVALLALDDLATREALSPALPWRDYAAIVAVTVAWFVVRRGIDAGQSFTMLAPTFFGLGVVGRISTMLPVVFVLVRLLIWPFDLSPDYFPEVVPRLEQPTLLGGAGLLLLVALAALAVLSWRRNRALSAGLGILGIAWLPTANLLFPTGIVLAERTLYLATVGVALVAAAGFAWLTTRHGARIAVAATGCVALAFGARAVSQIPVWRDNRDLALWALDAHPEAYRGHQAAARALVRLGDLPSALRQYAISIELYPLDHYNLTEAGAAALDAGRLRVALAYLRRAGQLDSTLGLTQLLLARALLTAGAPDQALLHARRAVGLVPRHPEAARMLAASFMALGEKDSALAVWPAFRRRGGSPFEAWLLEASTLAAAAQPGQARAALDSAARHAARDSTARGRLESVRALIEKAERR
jgi:tetratricopeptide (TPR) repeat protein